MKVTQYKLNMYFFLFPCCYILSHSWPKSFGFMPFNVISPILTHKTVSHLSLCSMYLNLLTSFNLFLLLILKLVSPGHLGGGGYNFQSLESSLEGIISFHAPNKHPDIVPVLQLCLRIQQNIKPLMVKLHTLSLIVKCKTSG